MKNRGFILSFLILLITNFAFAQTTSKKVNYQAVVRNAANELVTNESLSVEITILNANNVPQYRETHASVSTNQNGLLWLWVGEGTPTLGTLDEVVWKDATIQSVFTLPGGNTVTQNTPVSAMPYAYYADEVDTLFLQDYLTTHNYGNEDYVTHEQLDDTLSRYTTTDKIDTLLGAYYDTTQVKNAIHDTADAIRAAIPASQVNADWNATGGPAEILNKPDLGVYATNAHLNDTLNSFATKDTLSAYATKDTLANFATTNALKDSLTRYVDKDKLTDTLDRYYTKNNIDNKLNDYEKKSDLCGDVKECIKDTLGKYTTSNKIDTLLKDYLKTSELCDSVMNCEGIQTMQTNITNVSNNLDSTKTNIRSEINHMVTDLQNADNNLSTRIHNDSLRLVELNTKVHNDSTALAGKIHADSLTLAQRMDTVYKHLCDSVMNCEGIQTMQTNITNVSNNLDSTKTNIRNEINHMVTDLQNADNNLSTRIHNDSLRLVELNTKVHNDSVTLAGKIRTDSTALAGKIHADSLTLAQRMDTVYKHLCDSVMNCEGIQTMQTNITNVSNNLDSTKTNIRNEINHMVTDLQNADNNLSTRIHNDSLRLVELNTKVHNDSVTLAGKIRTDSTTLAGKIRSDSSTVHGALVDSLKHYLDSAQVVRSIHDSIGNGTLSIKYGDNAPVTFTANQKTPSNIEIPAAEAPVYGTLTLQKNGATIDAFTANTNKTINIEVPTKLSQLSNDGGMYAKRDSVNVFTNVNNFTSTVTVPSNTTTIPRPTTAAHPCTDNTANAVNICDLLAVFDSLTKRMDAMQETIEGLRDSVKTLMPKLSLVANPTSGVVCGEKPATITYTANISNGNTADYQFKWTVNETDSTNVTGPTLTCRFINAGEYKAVCTATSTGRYTLKDSVTLTVTAGTPPVFSTSSNDLHLTLTSTFASDIDSIAWGDNNGKKNPTTPAEHEYSASGTYTITVFSTMGCKEEKEVTVKVGIETDKLTPCNVTAHTDNTIYTATTGGLETTNENGAVTMVQDQDGHEYYVTQIGTQCWMAENLRSTKYSSSLTGKLPNLHELPSQASTFIVDTAYYGYPNDNFTNYGLVYTWIAAMGGSSLERSQGICPDGWHVPSQSDFTTMITNASADNASGKLAGGETDTWTSSTASASPGNYDYEYRNESGFGALPAGFFSQAPLEGIGIIADFWTSTHQGYGPSDFGGRPTYYFLELSNSSSDAEYTHGAVGVENCFSLRCVRNEDGSSAPIAPTVSTTSPATDITSTSATLSGTYSANGNTISEKGFEWAVSGDSYTKKPVSGDELTCSLTDLTPSMNYVFRAYIVSNGATYYGSEVEFTTTPPCGTSKIIDASGNSYEIVLIGSQCWTKTNLRTTKKKNGEDLMFSQAASETSEDDAYYFKPVSSEEWKVSSGFGGSEVVPYSSYNDSVFGYYYNWPAAAGEGINSICPEGWHVPSIDDWNTLMTYLSANATYYSCNNDPTHIAKALSYTTYWKSTEMDCSPGNTPSSNDESGFSAIPAGYHNTDYVNYGFYDAGYVADFWSSTQYYYEQMDSYVGRYMRILWQESEVDTSWYWKDTGKSVRCVKDGDGDGETSQNPTVTTGAADPVGETTATLNASITNPDNVTITAKGFKYTSDGATWTPVAGTGEGNSFAANLTGLTAGTDYTYKAFIKFNNDTVYGSEATFTTNQAAGSFTCGTSTVTDADGNEYHTVQIGTQCWMAENLKSTQYSSNLSGTPNLSQVSTSDYSETGAYYSYPDNNDVNVNTYGLLYTWNAAMGGSAVEGAQGICPDGWHVPSTVELRMLWGGNGNSGYLPSTFVPQNAGYCLYDEGYTDFVQKFGSEAYYWSSTSKSSSVAYNMGCGDWATISEIDKANYAMSVRCVRDAE